MSRSRFGGYFKGWQRLKNHWQDMSVPTAPATPPETVVDLDYSKVQGIWDLSSTTQFPKKTTVSVDVEQGLLITNSFPAGPIDNGSINRSANVVFACEVTLPASFTSDGVLFEMGGNGTGAGVGLTSGGANLTVAAGDGAATSTSATAAIAQISTSTFTAGQTGTLVWEFRVNPGRVRAWWNGALIADEATSGGGPLEGSTWSGTDGGGYGLVSNSLHVALVDAAWPGSTGSALRYYENQLVSV